MKKIILIFLCFSSIGVSQICNGQNQEKADSLQNLLNRHLERDTIRVKLLSELATNLMTNDLERAKKVIDEQIHISDSLKYKFGLAFGYMRLSYYYGKKNNDSLYLISCKKALENAEQIKNIYIKGVIFLNLGVHQMLKLGNIDSALIYFNNSIKCLKNNDSKSKEMLGLALSNAGAIYLQNGDFKKALEYFLNAQKVMEESKSTTYLSTVYYNLSLIYSEELKNDKTAKEYAEKALKVSEESGNKIGIAQGNDRVGTLEKDNLKTRAHYRKALEIYEQIGDKEAISNDLNNIGRTFELFDKDNNYDSALYYFEKSLAQNTGDQTLLMDSHQLIGFGNYKKSNYESALKHYFIALEIAKKLQSVRTAQDIMSDMIKVYAALKNYKKAYEYSQSYAAIRDSLLDAEKVKSLNEMSAKYESVKKEKEITVLNKDKEIQNIEIKKQKLLKYSFIGGLGVIIILLLFGYRFYRAQQVLRLQSIRNKISGDLHDDIGSTLNSISIYSEVARKKDEQQDEALEMIGDASRKIIDAMSDIVWTINPENDSFAKIIFRMKSLAYNLFRAKKIEFTFHSDEILNEKKLSIEERRNFYLIFKEAVNNLVKYSNATRVAITLSNENDYIKLRIQDDGAGFDMTQDTAGNGLKNMKRRADEMKAKFKMESSKGNGTQIELILKT